MKLAFCIFTYHPFGGLQRDFLRIVKAAVAHGHTVTVFTSGWQGEKPDNLSIKLISLNRYTNHQRMKQFSDKLQSEFKDFDCVIGFNRMPGLDVFFAGESCYAAGIEKKKSFWFKLTSRYKIYKKLEEGVYGENSTTQALLLSPAEKTLILKYYPATNDRLYLLKPGIEKNRIPQHNQAFMRETFRKQLNIQTFMLLMIGSDFRRKGVDRALYAVAHLPEDLRQQIQLVIIGQGDQRPYVRLAKKLKIAQQVHFLGPRENAPEYLLAADVLLHPAREEAAGMVLVEAIVAALPMIVSSNCGYAYLVEAAQAGQLLPEPFKQTDFDLQLKKLLQEELALYRNSMIAYQSHHDLFCLEEAVIDFIERRGYVLGTNTLGVNQS